MSNGGTVTVEVAGRDVNLVALLSRLESTMKRTDQVGIQLASTVGGTFTAAQQRAANSAITEAQALSRAAIAAGDNARAHSILVNALGQSAAASDRSVASLTTSINKLQSGKTAFTQFGDAAKSSILGIVGPMALLSGGIAAATGVVNSFVAAFKFKAELDGTTASVNSQLKGVRDMSQVWSEAAATAKTYRLTQADTNAILASSVDVLRTSKASVGELETALLRLGSRDPSKPISEAARALRELNSGDVTTIKEIFNIGAQDALRMKNEIQGGADAVQVLTTFLDKAGSGMDILAQRTTGALGAMNQLKIANEELALAQAQWAEGPGLAILQARIVATKAVTAGLGGEVAAQSATVLKASTSYITYAAAIERSNKAARDKTGAGRQFENLPALTEAQFNYAKSLEASGVASDAARAAAIALNDTLIQIGQVQAIVAEQGGLSTEQLDRLSNTILRLNAAGGEGAAQADLLVGAFQRGAIDARQLAAAIGQIQPVLDGQAAAARDAAVAASAHSSGMENEIQAAIAAGAALREEAAATAAATTESQLAAQAASALAAESALLMAQTQGAADAFLALHPNISASAAAAVAAAAGYSPQIVRLIELTARAREARNALAALNALAGVQALRAPTRADSTSDVTSLRTSLQKDDTAARAKALAVTLANAEAERRYQLQLGNTAPALERARLELAQLTKGSAAHYDKLRQIDQLEKTGAKGAKGGGAGAAKISDQSKLNNTLLSDQERYQDQAENAERAHAQKVLGIERDFQEKSLAQQRQNEISKRESELGFLESITASELNKTKEGRAAITQINERYYADFAAAQAAAQAGNAAQSEAMVKLAGERAAAEQRYAEQIDKARQEKNASEVTRLEALREKQRQILDEKQKQIAAAGDPNVVAKTEALAEEDQRFVEQQGKGATAAEQAAQRKVDAARRSGKAVADENTLLLEQEKIQNRLGRTAAPGAPGVTPPGGAAAATPTTAGGAVDLGTLAAGLDAIVGAVGSMKDAITRAQGDTTNAVRGLGSRLSGA